MEEKNFGLRTRVIKNGDFVFRTPLGLDLELLQKDRDYSPYLPIWETQIGKYGDTYGCVTFSALNCLEVLFKRKYNIDINFSDNFTVVMSGTEPYVGNYLTEVGDSIRKKHGLLTPESKLTWDSAVHDINYYYDKGRITQEMKDEALAFLDNWAIMYQWILPERNAFWDALQYGPIQVTVNTSAKKDENGIYQKVDSNRTSHAIMAYKAVYEEYFECYDHYQNKFKKYAWDFNFGTSFQYSLTKIIKNNMKLLKSNDAKNKTVFLVDDLGQRRVFFNEEHFNAVAPALGLAKTKEQNGGKTDWSQVQEVSEDELNKYRLARPLYEVVG